MELNLNLPYVVRDEDKTDPIWREPRKVSDWLLRGAINSKWPQGIKSKTEQKLVGRIQAALAKALASKSDTLEVTRDQAELLLDAVKEWSVPASFTHWYLDLQDYLEAAVKADGDKDKKPAGG